MSTNAPALPAKKMYSPKQLFGFGPDKEILEGYAEQPYITKGYKSNPNHVFTKDQVRMLLACFISKTPVLISGLEGCGKSSGLVEFLLRLNLPFRVMQGSSDVDRFSLFGSKNLDPNGVMKYVKGPITECYQNGWPVIIEEATKCTAEALVSLNGVRDKQPILLEENGNEVVPMAEGFWLTATSNGNGSGKNGFATEKKQDRSLMSGFALLKGDYLSKDDEIKVLTAATPALMPEVAELLVMYAGDTRAAAMSSDPEKQIEVPLSTRGLKMAAEICVMTMGPDSPDAMKAALDVVYLNKLNDQDRASAELIWQSYKGTSS